MFLYNLHLSNVVILVIRNNLPITNYTLIQPSMTVSKFKSNVISIKCSDYFCSMLFGLELIPGICEQKNAVKIHATKSIPKTRIPFCYCVRLSKRLTVPTKPEDVGEFDMRIWYEVSFIHWGYDEKDLDQKDEFESINDFMTSQNSF